MLQRFLPLRTLRTFACYFFDVPSFANFANLCVLFFRYSFLYELFASFACYFFNILSFANSLRTLCALCVLFFQYSFLYELFASFAPFACYFFDIPSFAQLHYFPKNMGLKPVKNKVRASQIKLLF